MPTLSVITPTYNHAHYLPRAIEAVVQQSRQPDEYIILDDGSTDNSFDVLQEYAALYPFIRVIRKTENQGLMAALACLMDEVTGDFVYAGAADDCVLPGFFEKAMDLLAEHPQAGLLFGGVRLCDTTGKTLGESTRNGEMSRFLPPDRYLAEFLDVEAVTASPSVGTIFRRSALVDVGGFRPELGPWTDTFAIRAIGLKSGVCYLAETCATQFVSPEGYARSCGANPRLMLDIVARAAWLMRSDEFRGRFPEEHVGRWEAGYRADVGERAVEGVALRYDDAGVAFLGSLSLGNGRDRLIGRLLMKLGGVFRRLQLAWLRHVLHSYKGDVSLYLGRNAT